MHLSHHILRIGELAASLNFYQDTLGMTLIHQDVQSSLTRTFLGFGQPTGPNDANRARRQPFTMLELWHQAKSNRSLEKLHAKRDDAYWKIGITLSDVDRARQALLGRGLDVTKPQQFLDIGYLCHLHDPDGFELELLQHDFANHFRPTPPSAHPLRSLPTLGQVTLRVRDAASSLRFYESLGLTLLSRQVVAPYRFTLYFLAHTHERPPDLGLDAVSNREWLWRRPYTTLELQHRWSSSGALRHHTTPVGFWGLSFTTPNLKTRLTALARDGIRILQPVSTDSVFAAPVAVIADPDGNRIRLIEEVG